MRKILMTIVAGAFLSLPVLASDEMPNSCGSQRSSPMGYPFQKLSQEDASKMETLLGEFRVDLDGSFPPQTVVEHYFLRVGETPCPALRLHGYKAMLYEIYHPNIYGAAIDLCSVIHPEEVEAFKKNLLERYAQSTDEKAISQCKESIAAVHQEMQGEKQFTNDECKLQNELNGDFSFPVELYPQDDPLKSCINTRLDAFFKNWREGEKSALQACLELKSPKDRLQRYKTLLEGKFDLTVFKVAYGLSLLFDSEKSEEFLGLTLNGLRKIELIEECLRLVEAVNRLSEKLQNGDLWMAKESEVWRLFNKRLVLARIAEVAERKPIGAMTRDGCLSNSTWVAIAMAAIGTYYMYAAI